MPAGMVRPRPSQVPPLRGVIIVQYQERGWQVSAGGRVESGSRVGPCGRCREPCVRYGPTGQSLCPSCRRPAEPAVPERRPVPARITMALDLRSLYGPEVDRECGTFEGNPAGDVDAWEEGRAIPSPEQVEALARLTSMPVDYFYKPADTIPGQVFICDRSRRKHGLTMVESRVDERGVLHRQFRGGPP